MIKNIIFDLGNIIIKNPDITTIQHFVSDLKEAELLKEWIFKSPEWKLLDKGQITNEEAIKNIQNRAPEKYFDIICTIMTSWFTLLPTNKDSIEIAKKLKQNGYSIFVLSNMAIQTYEYFKDIEFFTLCNGIVISGYENMVKPSKEIFERLLNRFHISADETLLIDDDDTNKTIEVANVLGISCRRVLPNSSEDILALLKENEIVL